MTRLPGMDRSLTVTLRGPAALSGFHRGFSLQELRTVNFDHPDGRVLIGRFHTQPPMNVATVYRLNTSTRALYVRGAAFDSENDLHAPLIHAPGHSVTLPLSAPPPAPGDLLARLTAIFERARWRFARTYAGGDAEHWYTKRQGCTPEEDEQFLFATQAIQRFGHREHFHGSWWTALDCGEYHYWCGRRYPPPPSALINRRPLQRDPIPIVADQVLVAENAALLPLPLLPGVDPRRTLAYLLFGGAP